MPDEVQGNAERRYGCHQGRWQRRNEVRGRTELETWDLGPMPPLTRAQR
jgi:hypothetical protein